VGERRFGLSTHLFHDHRLTREHLALAARHGFDALSDGSHADAIGGDSQRAHEIGVAVGRAQLLCGSRPLGRYSPAAHYAAGFDFEDIREIGPQHDLQLEAHGLHAVIRDVEVLVHAARNRSAHDQAQCSWRDCAVLRHNAAVREVNFRGVVADGAAVQEVPGHAVGINCPATEDARVEEEQSALAWPVDPGVELGHQHGLTMVNGNLRRTNVYFERHGAPGLL